MPLDRATLLDLQAENMADDLPIDESRMLHWTVTECERYFESGGIDRPAWDSAPISAPGEAVSVQAETTAAHVQEPAHDPTRQATHSKPRLLCLHGSASNAEATMFQVMILGLYDLDEKSSPCDCVFLEGPHLARGAFDPHLQGEARSWHTPTQPLEVGLRHVVSHIEEHGPYDGVYGFSQGCCMIAMLSDPTVWRDLGGGSKPPWRFVIMGCGTDYLLPYPEAPKIEQPMQVPSLHIMGKYDSILHASKSLARRYAAPLELVHDGAHAMPMSLQDGSYVNTEFLRRVKEFVDTHHKQLRVN